MIDIFFIGRIQKEDAYRSLLDFDDKIKAIPTSVNQYIIMSDNYNQLVDILGPRLTGFITVRKQTTGNYLLWNNFIATDKLRKELAKSIRFRYCMYVLYVLMFLSILLIRGNMLALIVFGVVSVVGILAGGFSLFNRKSSQIAKATSGPTIQVGGDMHGSVTLGNEDTKDFFIPTLANRIFGNLRNIYLIFNSYVAGKAHYYEVAALIKDVKRDMLELELVDVEDSYRSFLTMHIKNFCNALWLAKQNPSQENQMIMCQAINALIHTFPKNNLLKS